MDLRYPFDTVWDAASQVLQKAGWTVSKADRSSGRFELRVGGRLGYMLTALEHELLGRVERSSHDTRRIPTSSRSKLSIPIAPIREQTRVVEYLEAMRKRIEAMRVLQNESLEAVSNFALSYQFANNPDGLTETALGRS